MLSLLLQRKQVVYDLAKDQLCLEPEVSAYLPVLVPALPSTKAYKMPYMHIVLMTMPRRLKTNPSNT